MRFILAFSYYLITLPKNQRTVSVNAAFTGFSDRCKDYQVKAIQSIEITVDQVMDYRKITTSFPLLGKLTFEIDQKATIQIDKQLVRFNYQGELRGFQGFLNPINALLSNLPFADFLNANEIH